MSTKLHLSQQEQDRLQVLLVLQSHFMESLNEAYNDIKVITNRLEQWEQEIQSTINRSLREADDRSSQTKGCA